MAALGDAAWGGDNDAVIDPTTIHVLVVIFIATLIRSTLGFGEALVAVPLLALRIPVSVAAPLAVLVSVLVAGVIVIHDWRKVQVAARPGSWSRRYSEFPSACSCSCG